MGKIVDVVINFDHNFISQAAVLAHSLNVNSSIEVLHVFYSGSAHKLNSYENMLGPVKFKIQYYFVEDMIHKLPNKNTSSQIPTISYARLLITKLLNRDIKRVLYLDIDVLIKGPIDDLLQFITIKPIAAVRSQREGFYNSRGEEVRKYFNAGVLLIDLEALRISEYDEVILKTMAISSPFEYMDQDILNLVFEDAWEELPQKWNFFSTKKLRYYQDDSENVIVHFAGIHKPWVYPNLSVDHKKWRKLHLKLIPEVRKTFVDNSLTYYLVHNRFLRLILFRKPIKQ